ncbi:thymidine phosphorylase [Loktanella sp. IMCC34160]|uniref:thymidine phosphorylase n=1 Tax=Loktanella sp. IMCC34160 TaxID=2510646 RepID=UPI00101DF28C|nr:thymidine phosphorylase [Loktanella sp. IMCC34160]RYG89676.1 thymidine phosphorylase [Loktanella sp. IMCC34160]
MDARAIIAKLRNRDIPTAEELQWFANGLASGAVSDAQAGAFAMAVLLNGIGAEGRVNLTRAMRDSGDVLRWDMPGPVVDKHSTGGVGDCVSLILAPALAACGAFVPMISGRGLGHTGGTLDKMEAIPGVVAQIEEDKLRPLVRKVGCAVVGATGRIAPADRRLYAIRDVTATVESIDLITASILSKKLSAGLEALVMDVKVGTGAFMKTADDARALARSIVDTANGAGCATAALITDMNEPLAPVLGNALEVAICMEVMAGNRAAAPRLHDLTVSLGGRLLALVGEEEGEAEEKMAEAISSGRAMTHFAAMVAELGGPPDMEKDWMTHLPKAPVIGDVPAPRDGYINEINGEALGLAVVDLGGGRRVETDRIDPAVGLTDVVGRGVKVAKGDPLCTIHARTEAGAEAAAKAVIAAIRIGDAPEAFPLVHERID